MRWRPGFPSCFCSDKCNVYLMQQDKFPLSICCAHLRTMLFPTMCSPFPLRFPWHKSNQSLPLLGGGKGMGEGRDGRREEEKGEGEGERKENNIPYKILPHFIVERRKRLQREYYGTTDTPTRHRQANNSTKQHRDHRFYFWNSEIYFHIKIIPL